MVRRHVIMAIAWSALLATLSLACGDGTAGTVPPVADGDRDGGVVLLLETAAPRLRLLRDGALLREFPLLTVDRGDPSVLFVPRRSAATPDEAMPLLVGIEPHCRPERLHVIAPPPGREAPEPVIPPDPSESCPAPDRFLIRFDRGPVLEIRPASEDGAARSPSAAVRIIWKLRDLGDAVTRPAPRLRVVMDAGDAGALYRSLPDGAGLVIL